MAFTTGEREELAAARMRVRELEIKEQEVIEQLACVLKAAGLTTVTDDRIEWSYIARNHADAIRDALAPFDSGYRAAEDAS